MFKKIGSLILGLVIIVSLASCTNSEVDAGSYYVAIDINPSIEFVVDEDDNIVSYNLLNEDAEILVADLEFIGMNIDDAVEMFINLATEAGFIDVDCEDNAVLITVLGNEENNYAYSIRTRISNRVRRYFVKNYISGEILTDEFTDEDLVNQADELGVTVAKLSMALLILDTDTNEDYELETLLDTPVKDLVEIIKLYHQESFQEFTQEQIAEFQQRRAEFMEQHQERFNEWVENHPGLTDEEIDQAMEQYKETIKAITREKWQQRIEEWKNNKRNQNDNSTTETEETSEVS